MGGLEDLARLCKINIRGNGIRVPWKMFYAEFHLIIDGKPPKNFILVDHQQAETL